MNPRDPHQSQPVGCSELTRRDFVRYAAAALGTVPIIGSAARAAADQKPGPTPANSAETATARLYKTLSDEQKNLICFPFDHPKRSQVNNNWAIVKPTIADMTKEQQALCREIMQGLCSEDGFDRFMRQMDADYGGFENYHVAIFGEPGTDKPFEWVVTGRHDTLRADGNSVEGVAFGGPIFYGHDATGSGNDDASHSENVWWYQGEQANKIFQALDDKQRAQALIDVAEPDTPASIKLKGDAIDSAPGLAVASMDPQQKEMVRKLLKDMLLPYRAVDVEEVNACINDAGGPDRMRITFYKEGDIGNDGVWDIWKLEGPAFAWYFRGSPHVHTWLHVARRADYHQPASG